MLNRNTKLIWREGGGEGERKAPEVGQGGGQPNPPRRLKACVPSRAHARPLPSVPSAPAAGPSLTMTDRHPHLLSSRPPEGSRACFCTRTRRKKAASEGSTRAQRQESSDGPQPRPAQGHGRNWARGSAPALLPLCCCVPTSQLGSPRGPGGEIQPEGVINNPASEGAIRLSSSAPHASKTPEPLQPPPRQ